MVLALSLANRFYSRQTALSQHLTPMLTSNKVSGRSKLYQFCHFCFLLRLLMYPPSYYAFFIADISSTPEPDTDGNYDDQFYAST